MGKINKIFYRIILLLFCISKIVAMSETSLLTQEITQERNSRQISKFYQSMLDFFEKELKENMEMIQKTIDKSTPEEYPDSSEFKYLSEEFCNQLLIKQNISLKKINILKTALNNSLLFRPGIQKILIQLAKEMLSYDFFADKIQFFYNLEAGSKTFEDILKKRIPKNGYEIDNEMAEKIKQEDFDDYNDQQLLLFFDILTDLVHTKDFKLILEEEAREMKFREQPAQGLPGLFSSEDLESFAKDSIS